jgi:hypothetical protein
MVPNIKYDNLIFTPLCRLPNGNLLIMARIAETLINAVVDEKA